MSATLPSTAGFTDAALSTGSASASRNTVEFTFGGVIAARVKFSVHVWLIIGALESAEYSGGILLFAFLVGDQVLFTYNKVLC